MSRLEQRVGVCSWSLQPGSPRELCERVRSCGLDAVQLALEPIRSGAWSLDETIAELRRAGIRVLSGMMETKGEDYTSLESIHETGGVRPDATWEANQEIARGCAAIAEAFELELVTLHAGFLPESAEDPEQGVMIERLRWISDVFAGSGVRLGLETGQELASTLVSFLEALDRESVGVNFDPANMILYGMGDPVEAMGLLADRVVQVHIKDATATKVPGTWGAEVPAGTGEVHWDAFLTAARAGAPGVDLIIEREAGEQRIADVRTAVSLIASHRDTTSETSFA